MKTNPVKEKSKEKKSGSRIPWLFDWEIQDLISPITIRRRQIFSISIIVLLLSSAGFLFWYNFLKAPSGEELVNNMVEASGGMDTWNNIQQGRFSRTHNLYNENGDILRSKIETFYFKKTPVGVKLMVNAVAENGDEVWVGRDENGYWASNNNKTMDPVILSKEMGMMCESEFCDPLCASTMAFYRFSMPFKLTDSGVRQRNMGSFTLNGEPVNMLEITFDPEVGRDRWVFYAAEGTNLIKKVEYHHKTDAGYSLPEEIYWSNHKEVNGFTFSHKWTRYHSNGNVLEEYLFSDVDFETEIDNQIFNRPEKHQEEMASAL
jgi:hypothetical protein